MIYYDGIYRVLGLAFGVPLDGGEEGVAWGFECFDDAVVCSCGSEQAIAETVDALMMVAHNFYAVSFEPLV